VSRKAGRIFCRCHIYTRTPVYTVGIHEGVNRIHHERSRGGQHSYRWRRADPKGKVSNIIGAHFIGLYLPHSGHPTPVGWRTAHNYLLSRRRASARKSFSRQVKSPCGRIVAGHTGGYFTQRCPAGGAWLNASYRSVGWQCNKWLINSNRAVAGFQSFHISPFKLLSIGKQSYPFFADLVPIHDSRRPRHRQRHVAAARRRLNILDGRAHNGYRTTYSLAFRGYQPYAVRTGCAAGNLQRGVKQLMQEGPAINYHG
jgi:hypothetical protein